MRISVVIFGLILVLLQYRVWVSDQGLREVSRLAAAIKAQAAANVGAARSKPPAGRGSR